jgi:hypothetical protein
MSILLSTIGAAMAGDVENVQPLHVPARFDGSGSANGSLSEIAIVGYANPVRVWINMSDAPDCMLRVVVSGGAIRAEGLPNCHAVAREYAAAMSNWSVDATTSRSDGQYSFLVHMSYERGPQGDLQFAEAIADAVRVPSTVVTARKRVAPRYPIVEDGHGVSCRVLYTNSSEGFPQAAVVYGCPDPFRESVEAVAMQSHFEPYRVDGRPVPVQFEVLVPVGPAGTVQQSD